MDKSRWTNDMKSLLTILLLTSTIIRGQSAPCQHKSIRPYNKNMYDVTIYPNCNDTTVFISRTYENNKLWREEWFKNKLPHGLSKYYDWTDSNNVKSSESLWENGLSIHTTVYFTKSSIISDATKRITDTTDFQIKYFRNGNIKEYGNVNTKNSRCPYGQWTEFDSTGTYKWTGSYKFVNKSRRDTTIDDKTGETIVYTITTCSEKDGAWKKTNKDNKVIEQVIYINGKPKDNH